MLLGLRMVCLTSTGDPALAAGRVTSSALYGPYKRLAILADASSQVPRDRYELAGTGRWQTALLLVPHGFAHPFLMWLWLRTNPRRPSSETAGRSTQGHNADAPGRASAGKTATPTPAPTPTPGSASKLQDASTSSTGGLTSAAATAPAASPSPQGLVAHRGSASRDKAVEGQGGARPQAPPFGNQGRGDLLSVSAGRQEPGFGVRGPDLGLGCLEVLPPSLCLVPTEEQAFPGAARRRDVAQGSPDPQRGHLEAPPGRWEVGSVAVG